MKTDYFDYPTPYTSELEEMYYPKHRVYDFSPELKEAIHHIFSHPSTKYHKEFYTYAKDWRVRDMIKRAYLLTRYYLDNPQQYGHDIKNISPQLLVLMWKSFIRITKALDKAEYRKYMATDMKMLKINGTHFAELLVREVRDKKYTPITYMAGTRATLKEGTANFEYLANLE